MGEPQAAIAAMGRQVDVRIATVEAVGQSGGVWALDTSAGRFTATAVVIAAGVEHAGSRRARSAWISRSSSSRAISS